jgi:hypothetical protein
MVEAVSGGVVVVVVTTSIAATWSRLTPMMQLNNIVDILVVGRLIGGDISSQPKRTEDMEVTTDGGDSSGAV